MARTAKLDLRSFQQELAARLASKTAAQVESSRLGLACGGEQWLVRLGDAGEVVAVPPVTPVPHTQRWHLGIANVRGNLYSVIDFARYLGRESAGVGAQSRLVLFGPRAGDLNAGIVVGRVLGLRNLAQLAPAGSHADAPAWFAQRWMDADGRSWQEIDLSRLARDDTFLQIGA